MTKIVLDLEHMVTNFDLCNLFGVRAMTLTNWRMRSDPLPFIEIPGSSKSSVRYDLREVVKWAEKNGKQIPKSNLKRLQGQLPHTV